MDLHLESWQSFYSERESSSFFTEQSRARPWEGPNPAGLGSLAAEEDPPESPVVAGHTLRRSRHGRRRALSR